MGNCQEIMAATNRFLNEFDCLCERHGAYFKSSHDKGLPNVVIFADKVDVERFKTWRASEGVCAEVYGGHPLSGQPRPPEYDDEPTL
jgi:hypothetical protein